jgi:hypothetical protein
MVAKSSKKQRLINLVRQARVRKCPAFTRKTLARRKAG